MNDETAEARTRDDETEIPVPVTESNVRLLLIEESLVKMHDQQSEILGRLAFLMQHKSSPLDEERELPSVRDSLNETVGILETIAEEMSRLRLIYEMQVLHPVAQMTAPLTGLFEKSFYKGAAQAAEDLKNGKSPMDILHSFMNPPSKPTAVDATCPTCGGTGIIPALEGAGEMCFRCNGTGKL